tara:strand:+ start:631 stop:837 length:207 start_codon:yes stop_codon:yes gene_type:complete
MILKIVVLIAIIATVWYGFKMIGRRNIAKQREDAQKAEDAGETMAACSVCGTYVPESQKDCGRDACPY